MAIKSISVWSRISLRHHPADLNYTSPESYLVTCVSVLCAFYLQSASALQKDKCEHPSFFVTVASLHSNAAVFHELLRTNMESIICVVQPSMDKVLKIKIKHLHSLINLGWTY